MNSTKSEGPPQIHIREVIRAKNPKLLKWLPGPIISYIRKVLHEDEINAFLAANYQKLGFDFVDAIIGEFKPRVVIEGLENIPDSGRIIIVSNHPLGGLDGMALLHAISKKRKDVRFVVNDILLNLKSFNGIFIPVNKHGRNAAESVRLINEAYSSDGVTVIFPAGLVSRKINGIITDLPWQKSFMTKARQHQAPVLPAFIGGTNSKRFYRIARLRALLKIKANIEMFYLVDEMYRQYHKPIKIVFGEPIPGNTWDGTVRDLDWVEKIRKEVYQLEKKQPHAGNH